MFPTAGHSIQRTWTGFGVLVPAERHLQHVRGYPSISCPQGAQQQTRRQPLLLSISWTDDGQTDTRPLHKPCSTYYVGCVDNLMMQKTLDVIMTSQRLNATHPTCRFYAPSADAAR